MRKLLSILAGIILSLILVICQSNTGTNEKKAQSLKLSDETSEDATPHYHDSLVPLATTIQERRINEQTIIDKSNTDIEVYLLQHDYNSLSSFVKTEIANHTPDTIFYRNDHFRSYNDSTNSWTTMCYPDNYAKVDITQFIPPGEAKQFQFFFPVSPNSHKGTYRLDLIFQNTTHKSYYYVSKNFKIK